METFSPQSKSNMLWEYRLADRALKNLKRFPFHDQKKIFLALLQMQTNPFLGDVKSMQGEENLYRRRVGNYRIYFRPQLDTHVLDIPEILRKQSH